jgi:hypothetical protein
MVAGGGARLPFVYTSPEHHARGLFFSFSSFPVPYRLNDCIGQHFTPALSTSAELEKVNDGTIIIQQTK